MTARAWAVVVFTGVTLLYAGGLVLYGLAGERFGFLTFVAVALFGFPLVGVLIAYRRPDNRIAWLCLAIGVAWGLDQALWGIAHYGMANPGVVARPELFAVVADPLWVFAIFGILTYVLMLFPDGRLPSPRWKWLPVVTTLILVTVYGVHLFQPETSSYGRIHLVNPMSKVEPDTFLAMQTAALLPQFGVVIASVVALIVRFRRSRGVERQQLRWLAWAGAVAVLVFLPAVLTTDYVGDGLGLAAGLVLVLIPVAIGIAISRYRLYDLDRVLSRTVSYVLILALLAGVYFWAVTLLSGLLPRDSSLAVAASTLAAATLFNPLRRRVQSFVDHRFNRSRYDAQQVMDRFVTSLQDRTDASAIVDDWTGVVSSTMQPRVIGVWTTDDAAPADVTGLSSERLPLP